MWYNNNYGYPAYGAIPDALANARMQMQNPSNGGGIIWVLGEENAKSFPVPPNTTVTLWDKETQTIYIKSVDASGIPSMRVLEWHEKQTTAPAPTIDPNKYVTREEFERTINSIMNKEATANG